MWSLLLCAVALSNTRGKNVLLHPGHIFLLISPHRLKKKLVAEIKTMKMGSVEDFTCFINAVIDEKSFDKLEGYIKRGKER